MNKTATILIIIILIAASFSLGLFLGQKTKNQAAVSEPIQQLNDLVTTPLLKSFMFTVTGDVTAIGGKTLTISQEGKDYFVEVGENTSIFLTEVIRGAEGFTTNDTVSAEFTSIKMGDQVTVLLRGVESEEFKVRVESVNVMKIQE